MDIYALLRLVHTDTSQPGERINRELNRAPSLGGIRPRALRGL